MNAARIIETLQQHGITCRRDGDILKLRPATGTTPADLSELVRAHKPELMAMLPDTSPATVLRTRLLGIAEAYGVPAEIVHATPSDAVLQFCGDMTDFQLARWLNIVGTREMHRCGLLPSGVWAIPSVADVQP